MKDHCGSLWINENHFADHHRSFRIIDAEFKTGPPLMQQSETEKSPILGWGYNCWTYCQSLTLKSFLTKKPETFTFWRGNPLGRLFIFGYASSRLFTPAPISQHSSTSACILLLYSLGNRHANPTHDLTQHIKMNQYCRQIDVIWSIWSIENVNFGPS